MTTTTPGEYPRYSRPVYANQAAANAAAINGFDQRLRRIRRELQHDLGRQLSELVFLTGYSILEVEQAVLILEALGLAERDGDGNPNWTRYYAKDVPNG